jgi:hypothetical protein
MDKPKSKIKIVKLTDLARQEGFATVEEMAAACDAEAAAEMKLELSEALLRRHEARKARRAARANTEWLRFVQGLY